MDAGRKFWAAMIFLALSAIEVVVAMYLKMSLPVNTIESQAGVVSVFIAGNAAVSWAYSKSETRAETDATTRAIADRRTAAGDGTEVTP